MDLGGIRRRSGNEYDQITLHEILFSKNLCVSVCVCPCPHMCDIWQSGYKGFRIFLPGNGMRIIYVSHKLLQSMGKSLESIDIVSFNFFPNVDAKPIALLLRGIRDSLPWNHFKLPWPRNTYVTLSSVFQHRSSFIILQSRESHKSRQI